MFGLQRHLRRIVGLCALRPLVLLLYVFARALLRGRQIRIIVMDPRYFGHQCLEPEVFWNDSKTDTEFGSRNLWLCSLGKKSMASNRYLWELARKRLNTIPSWIVSEIKAIQCHRDLKGVRLLDASIYRLNFLAHRECLLPSGDCLSDRRDEILKNFREPRRPYVVFTIRDPRVIYDLYDPRNREIQEFLPSMEDLTNCGYNVIRITSRTSDVIRSSNPHILDWQTQLQGEPGDELSVMSGASFVVSSTTGGDCLALAYRRPVLYVDSARFYLAFLGTEYATIHIPRLVDIETGKRLGMSAILERGLGWVGDHRSFERAGVRIQKSSPIEISRAVQEFEKSRGKKFSVTDDVSQNVWRDLLMKFHGSEITPRHGTIRAKMLESSIAHFVNS